MSQIETASLHHTAVLWLATGKTDNYGNPKVGEPQEIECNWKFSHSEAGGDKGGSKPIRATVIVEDAVTVGSKMWLGELEDWYGTGSSGQDDEVMIVTNVDTTDDIRGRETHRSLTLMYAADLNPTPS